MISGALDLTENLDFREVRKVNNSLASSLVPWDSEKHKVSITSNDDVWQALVRYTNGHTQTSYMTVVHDDDELALDYDFTELYTTSYTTTGTRYTLYDDSNTTWRTSTSNQFYIEYHDEYRWDSIDSSITMNLSTNSISNVSVQKIDTSKRSKLIPWDIYEEELEPTLRNIPWFVDKYYSFSNRLNRIPWEHQTILPHLNIDWLDWYDKVPWAEDQHCINKRKERLSHFDHSDDMRMKIPWLNEMDHFELEAYLDELNGKDQSNYLTNLGHLGLSDTVSISSDDVTIEMIDDALLTTV